MRFAAIPVLLLSIAFIGLSFTSGEIESLPLGAEMPKAKMKLQATDGEVYSLMDLKGPNGLLVVFSCNTCPFVVGSDRGTEGWEGRYNSLYQRATARNMNMVLVNSNAAKRDKGDSMDDMIARQKEMGFGDIPYVLDQRSMIADAFGAKTTPHCFLFDKDGKLVYKGAIDDNCDDASGVTQNWAIDAINNCSKGQTVEPSSTKPLGCSIKRIAQK